MELLNQISLPEFQYTSVDGLNNRLNITKSNLSEYDLPSLSFGSSSSTSSSSNSKAGTITNENEDVGSEDNTVRIPDYILNKNNIVNTVSSNNISTDSKTPRYKTNSEWANSLTQSYKKAGITNANALRMLIAQDALESNWGKSAQGKFNYGNLTTGSKWKGDMIIGNDKDANGNAIKQRFRSYSNMDDYAKDKVQFLSNLYDFNQDDDINSFTSKLVGGNKAKRRYAEDRKYKNTLTSVYNSVKLQQGGTIRQDNTRVNLPKVFNPQDEMLIRKNAKQAQTDKLIRDNQSQLSQTDNSTYSNFRRKKFKEENAKNDFLLNTQYMWRMDPTRPVANTHDEVKREFAIQKSLVDATSQAALGELTGFGITKGLNKLSNIKVFPKANPTSRYRNIGNDKTGLNDLFSTGTVNPPRSKLAVPVKGINLQKNFNEAFFGYQGQFVDPKAYPGKYFVEADRSIDFIKPYSNQWGFTPVKDGVKTAIELSNPGLKVWQRGKVLGVPYMKQIAKPNQVINQAPNKIPQALNLSNNNK